MTPHPENAAPAYLKLNSNHLVGQARRSNFPSGLANLASALLILLISIVVFIPFTPAYPLDALDSSWMFALNDAVAKHLVFGRDVIFTFGPYACLYTTQFNPATDPQMLCSAALLAAGFAAILISLTAGATRIIAAGFAVFLLLIYRDAALFAVPFAALVLICRVALPPHHPAYIPLRPFVTFTLALTAVILSLLPMVKISFGTAAGAVMALGCLLLAISGRRRLAIGGILLFIASMLTLWRLAGQPLLGLPDFFLAQRPILSGYSAAMSRPGPAWQIALYAGCCLFFGILAATPKFLTGAAGRVFFIGAACILFFTFKDGFIRHDAHAMIAAGMLGVTGWMLLLSRNGLLPFAGFAAGLASWAAIATPISGVTLPMLPGDIKAGFVTAGDGLITRLTAPGQLRQNDASALRAIRSQQPLPKLAGTTDIYSYSQSALLAAGLAYDPRPVPQSYSAYTPGLERLNAGHLTGAAAPANILFALQPIDNHLPALEDGASWPALLSRYRIIGLAGGLAILKLNPAATAIDPATNLPWLAGSFHLGQSIALPQDAAPIWAEIDVRPTLPGSLITFLFKPPPLHITYVFANGATQTYRYIAGMGAAGFLAAPLVQSITDFTALALPDAATYFAGRRPVSLSIGTLPGAGWAWRSTFRLSFRPLQIPAQPASLQILFRPFKPQPQPATNLPATSDCSIDAINQQPVTHLPVNVGDFLQVDGWAAISVKNNLLPDATEITLTAPDGTITALPAERITRRDVNDYFKKPNLGPLGFTAAGALTALSGNQRLGLELTRHGKNWSCTETIQIHISPTPGP